MYPVPDGFSYQITYYEIPSQNWRYDIDMTKCIVCGFLESLVP